MFLFVIGLIFALIFIIALAVTVFGNNDVKFGGGITAGISGLIAIFLVFFSCVTTVGTKDVAVLKTFGRPSGHLDNGFHLKAPWQTTTELNDAVQTDTYASDEGDLSKPQGGATDTCIHVRIDRQATACVNTSIRWQIRPDGVDYLFRNYKDNDAITDNLVLRDLQQALNSAFLAYDPLGIDAAGHNTNPPLTTYAAKVRKELVGANGHSGEMGRYINVEDVIVPIINYDSATQSKVNQLLQQIAATRVAQQSEQTAIAQAKANEALSKSVSNDPGVLESKCLDIVQKSLEENRSLPAGFNCFSTTSTPVTIPAK